MIKPPQEKDVQEDKVLSEEAFQTAEERGEVNRQDVLTPGTRAAGPGWGTRRALGSGHPPDGAQAEHQVRTQAADPAAPQEKNVTLSGW